MTVCVCVLYQGTDRSERDKEVKKRKEKVSDGNGENGIRDGRRQCRREKMQKRKESTISAAAPTAVSGRNDNGRRGRVHA